MTYRAFVTLRSPGKRSKKLKWCEEEVIKRAGETSIYENSYRFFLGGGGKDILKGERIFMSQRRRFIFTAEETFRWADYRNRKKKKSVIISLKNVQLFQIMHRLLFAHDDSNVNCIFFSPPLKSCPQMFMPFFPFQEIKLGWENKCCLSLREKGRR